MEVGRVVWGAVRSPGGDKLAKGELKHLVKRILPPHDRMQDPAGIIA
jgi:hypothetical protein